MSLTLVTAFHPVRSGLDLYIKKFEDIVATGLPILLFLDSECSLPTDYPNVRVVKATMDKSWVPETVQLPGARSPIKDTVDYLVLMLHKMKYMSEAAALCDTPYIAWIDFGVSHIIRDKSAIAQKLRSLSSFSCPVSTILIAGCWGSPHPAADLWNSVHWRFCGGFFLGRRSCFPPAYARQMELVRANLPRLTWEVNYWTMMEEHFTWYAGDHNDSMIINLPYSPIVKRLTDEPYYLAGARKVAIGGPIEQYVTSVLQPTMMAVFLKTDMLVESAEFARMRKSSWNDPAIHDFTSAIERARPTHGLVPIVCADTSRNLSAPNVLLLPSDDTSFVEGIKLPCERPAWESRKNIAVWRGASSGCEHPSLRLQTARVATGETFDFKFIRGGWPQNDEKIPTEMFGSPLAISEQVGFKYILSVDGNGAASNIEWVFVSGAVPIIVSDKSVNFWFKSKLRDGVNCILIDSDTLWLLPSRIDWLRNNDDRAREIAENALEFARTELSPESQRRYLREQIEERIPHAFDWCEYRQPIGEHHTFLTEIAKSYKNATFVDIGTHLGASAYALSREPSNRVFSFDITHKKTLPRLPNVTYSLENIFSEAGLAKWKDVLLTSAVIFLDIDPHEGTQEYIFYEWLRDNDYKGILICDDIWWFDGMRRNFWYKIPYEHKIDVTDRAHCSGTGIVRFHPTERWPENPPVSNWTVVTGYFDLTRMPDASPSIRGRPFEHYLQHSTSTLMLDQNMVIFCEPHTVDAIRARRPANLASKTRYVVMNFEDFPMCKYREILNAARKERPSVDDRNTVSYYLLCMARYAMLKQAIAENPFGSTHFLWLNICIERMGIRNVREIPRVLQLQRDKFSTCYIDYQPPEDYLDKVMRWGKCSMCSGFFTGNAYYMKEFCDRIEKKFIVCALQGYGHADEQLFSLVYFDAPEIFEVYYGDYTEMITNYEYVKERASEPLRLLIAHSFAARDFATCRPACRKLWESYTKGYAKLTGEEVTRLRTFMSALE